MVDLRRELNHINKHLDRHERTAGEAVVWFEFIPFSASGSVYDDVYDESPVGPGGLSFGPAIIIPTIYVEEVEDTNRAVEDGRQPIMNLRLTISMKAMLSRGVTEPWEYQQHFRDRFYVDGRYFQVMEYRVRGRLRNEVVVGVEGNEIYVDQEYPNDEFFDAEHLPKSQDLPWPNTFP